MSDDAYQTDPLYQDPEAYDIAFGWNSLDETRQLVEIAGEIMDRRPLRFMEVGCGTGRVLRDLAGLGHQAVGLDLDPLLLRYARRRLAELDLSAELIQGDMRDFNLDDPIDLAISPINGIGYLTDPAELDRHLQAVAANLSKGGVYIIEMSFGPIEKEFLGKSAPWAFTRNNMRVLADWRLLRVEEETGLAINEATLIIQRPGESEKRIVCEHAMRKWDQPAFYGHISDSPLRLVKMVRRNFIPLSPEERLTYADDNVFVFLQK